MNGSVLRAFAAVLLVVAVAACSTATAPRVSVPAARGGAPSLAPPRPVNDADVHFVTGMIPHHAQAVLIAGWAPSHGAGARLRVLCERIIISQRDEIGLMRSWLRNNDLPVPAADATHMRMSMGGVEHDMLMLGMLTEEELQRLDRARGVEFDRLFLTFMIRHHEGALTMVDELFGSAGAAQDEFIYKLASDIWADQTAEIHRMQLMLDEMPPGGGRDTLRPLLTLRRG